jgi:hypothetical protein
LENVSTVANTVETMQSYYRYIVAATVTPGVLQIYCDNKAAIFFSHNNKSSGASKHIDLRYLVVRKRVQNHTINLEHIGTKEMIVDPLTKGLPPYIFEEHVASIGLMAIL